MMVVDGKVVFMWLGVKQVFTSAVSFTCAGRVIIEAFNSVNITALNSVIITALNSAKEEKYEAIYDSGFFF